MQIPPGQVQSQSLPSAQTAAQAMGSQCAPSPHSRSLSHDEGGGVLGEQMPTQTAGVISPGRLPQSLRSQSEPALQSSLEKQVSTGGGGSGRQKPAQVGSSPQPSPGATGKQPMISQNAPSPQSASLEQVGSSRGTQTPAPQSVRHSPSGEPGSQTCAQSLSRQDSPAAHSLSEVHAVRGGLHVQVSQPCSSTAKPSSQ